MDNLHSLTPKVPTSAPEDAIGFVTVIAKSLPELCHVLNQIRCDGRKSVKIHQVLMSQGKLAGQIEIHCLAEVNHAQPWEPEGHPPIVAVPAEQAPPVA